MVGPNGVGKTTFLRVLLGELPPDEREAGHREEHEGGVLRPDAGLAGSRVRRCTSRPRTGEDWVELGDKKIALRDYLDDLLFPVPMQKQKVAALSGGERNRLLLARLFLEGANVLVLDEPTNDLDIVTLNVLEGLLLSFTGSVLLVTHDRYFLDKVATSILAFEGDGRVIRYEGNYAMYRRLKEQAEAAKAAEAPQARAEEGSRSPAPGRGARSRRGSPGSSRTRSSGSWTGWRRRSRRRRRARRSWRRSWRTRPSTAARRRCRSCSASWRPRPRGGPAVRALAGAAEPRQRLSAGRTPRRDNRAMMGNSKRAGVILALVLVALVLGVWVGQPAQGALVSAASPAPEASPASPRDATRAHQDVAAGQGRVRAVGPGDAAGSGLHGAPDVRSRALPDPGPRRPRANKPRRSSWATSSRSTAPLPPRSASWRCATSRRWAATPGSPISYTLGALVLAARGAPALVLHAARDRRCEQPLGHPEARRVAPAGRGVRRRGRARYGGRHEVPGAAGVQGVGHHLRRGARGGHGEPAGPEHRAAAPRGARAFARRAGGTAMPRLACCWTRWCAAARCAESRWSSPPSGICC